MPRKTSLLIQLCSDARNSQGLNPMACQNCESPCEYGKTWLRQMGMPLPKETREPSPYPKDLPDLSTTFRAIYRRRNKIFLAQRI